LRAHVRYWAGLLGADFSACDGALERVGLGGISGLPARVLSAGQARRLALARLLAASRPIWLLDEPLGALDEAGRALVSELVRERLNGGIVVAATHDPLRVEAARIIQLGGA
jgi:heme exporter protein A